MSTRITLDEQKLLKLHDELLDELYCLYHVHPTKLKDFHLTPEELAIDKEGVGWSMYIPG